MKEAKRSILEVIQSSASEGKIGQYNVRTVPMTMLMVENYSHTHKWMIDSETGCAFEYTSNDIINNLRRSLVEPRHENIQLEVLAINTASKWFERTYMYLPLSVQGVEIYEGTLSAPQLDYVDKAMNSPKSASEIIGIENEDAPYPMPPRLWNIAGSVRATNGQFDRRLDLEKCVVEFSSSSGRYRMTKKECCSELYAPLGGMQGESITIADLLDGALSAPVLDAADAFAPGASRTPLKRQV